MVLIKNKMKMIGKLSVIDHNSNTLEVVAGEKLKVILKYTEFEISLYYGTFCLQKTKRFVFCTKSRFG